MTNSDEYRKAKCKPFLLFGKPFSDAFCNQFRSTVTVVYASQIESQRFAANAGPLAEPVRESEIAKILLKQG